MLEGGNKQLSDFFDRHDLSTSVHEHHELNDTSPRNRYKTNAAMFYRNNLELHVKNVDQSGPYRGRHVSRKKSGSKSKNSRTNRIKRKGETSKSLVAAAEGETVALSVP